MEINVTKFVNTECRMDYSASIAEVGPGAGPSTWAAACEYAEENPFLVSEEMLEDARCHFLEYGCWDREELDDASVQGLVVQEIASGMSEMEHYETYEEYKEAVRDGQACGRLCKGDDNQFYLYIGL